VELTRLPLKGKLTVAAMHPTLPLFAAEKIDPDWGRWPGLLLKPLGQVTVYFKTNRADL